MDQNLKNKARGYLSRAHESELKLAEEVKKRQAAEAGWAESRKQTAMALKAHRKLVKYAAADVGSSDSDDEPAAQEKPAPKEKK